MSLPFVYGWQADHEGCGYYRVAQPLNEYRRRGGPCAYETELSPENRERADVLIGQRIVGGPPSAAWREMCRNDEALCVLELDDDLWDIPPSNPAYGTFTPEYLANLRRNIECAHVVTVTTNKLANMLGELNGNIKVVPNRIPQWLTEHERPRTEELTVGWAGSASHQIDWDTALDPIGRFLKRNPKVQFHSVGGMYKSMLKWPKPQLRSTRWVYEVENYYKEIDFDIGVIPLAWHIFNQSKSNIKALEYAALGIPTLATHSEPYRDFVRHGITGYLIEYDHQWPSILRDLAENEPFRAKMGYEARELAKQHTIEGNLNVWLDAWNIKDDGGDSNSLFG